MKPESQPSSTGPENVLVETMPSVEVSNEHFVDSGIDKGAEQYERTAELSSAVSDIANLSTPVITTVDPHSNDAATKDLATTNSVAPAVASDDDLIEKEWVDRAKKIVVDTHDDPYTREREVSKLQSDYIKKRYGRELGVSE